MMKILYSSVYTQRFQLQCPQQFPQTISHLYFGHWWTLRSAGGCRWPTSTSYDWRSKEMGWQRLTSRSSGKKWHPSTVNTADWFTSWFDCDMCCVCVCVYAMFVCIVVLRALKSSLMAKCFPRINKISNPIQSTNFLLVSLFVPNVLKHVPVADDC